MFSINSWTKEWPTKENGGQWFFVRAFGKTEPIEIRVDENSGQIYLSPTCHSGIEKSSFGTLLALYPKGTIEFCGPIQMPPDYVRRWMKA